MSETWQTIGDRLDRLWSPPKPEPTSCREKQRAAGLRIQARIRRQSEVEYEAEMDERIRTESALIRAKNLRLKLDEASPGYVPRNVVRHRLPRE